MIVQVGSLEFHLIVENNKWKPHPTRLQSCQKRKKASFQALSCVSDRMLGRVCTRVKHVIFLMCVYVHAGVFTHLHVACESQKILSGVPNHFPFYLLKQGLLLH